MEKKENKNLNDILCSLNCIATRLLEDTITARRTKKLDKIRWTEDVIKDINQINDLIPDLDKHFENYKKEINTP